MKQAILRVALTMAVCAAGCSDQPEEPESAERHTSSQGTQDAGQVEPNEVVITGKLVRTDGSPLSGESVWGLFGKTQSISVGENGVLLNPATTTDEQGHFTLKLDRAVLDDEDEEMVIALSRFPPGQFTSRFTPLTDEKGAAIGLVFKPDVRNFDLGTITVKSSR